MNWSTQSRLGARRGLAARASAYGMFLVAGIATSQAPSYSGEVRPLLAEHCFACHGPDDASRKGDLRLDVPGHDRGEAILDRIASTDPEHRMPPPHTGKSVDAEEAAILRRWIAAGTPYERHWAFVRPERPAVPSSDESLENPIDAFVRAELPAHGLEPSPPADRLTLVRRLYLDLVGLPPTPEAADRFAADEADDAYERLVDELLASPHYGERHARRWLDLARYADTNGYEKDRPRSIWPYRDWVVNAINADMPFDDFVVRQLAGDMLPDATASDLIATGFHRNTMLNEEGGIDPLEFRFHALTDRVATTGTVFLGLTVGCAQCHTHKFDPITHREYFGLMAYFDDADEPDFVVPDEEAEKRNIEHRLDAERRLDELWQSWPTIAGAREERFAAWQEECRNRLDHWQPARVEHAFSEQMTLTVLADSPGTVVARGDTTKHDAYSLRMAPSPRVITALRLEALPDPELPAGGPGTTYYEGRKGDFFLTELRLGMTKSDGEAATTVRIARATESYSKNQFANQPARAQEAIDGDLQTGWSAHLRNGERHVAVFEFESPIPADMPWSIEMHFGRHFASSLGRFRLSVADSVGGADALALPFDDDGELESLLMRAPHELDDTQSSRVRRAFVLSVPELGEKTADIRNLLGHQERTTTLVLRERQSGRGRVTRVHHRGEYLQPGESVEPHLPDALGATDAPKDRLEFARWLVSADNPLAARVVVNRQWALFFGRGLVATPGDFGVQGAVPTHPELLDWLAVRFMSEGWSIKRLHRWIVTSRTYRQSSAVRPTDLDRDPANLWLARAPRLRLDAEVLRDSVLVATAKLCDRVGGPPVRPPQPPGVTEVTFGSPSWRADDGEDRFRRSLYTFQKRTAPFAFHATFDAPSGESCVVHRASSDTPLQALALLNDPMLTELHLAFGEELAMLARQHGSDSTLTIAFRRVCTRAPAGAELDALRNFLARQLERTDPTTAWSAVGRALLCLEEAATRG
ncbi:MAG: DUF1553 domain-containing protein [Planctomycetota bacterium]